MRRLVYALSLTTVAFAVSTAYFARALYLERARSETGSVPIASPEAPAGKVAAAKPSPQPSARSRHNVEARTTPEAVTTVVSQASPDPVKELAELSDPAQRAKKLEQRKDMLLMNHPGLAEHLHLDEDEFERFIDLSSRHELDLAEASLRCYLDESCRTRGVDRSLMDAQKREVADLFGAQTVEAFEFYRYSSGERQAAKELRARLPDKHRLSDSQSQALVEALYEEQKRINRDRQQRRMNVGTFNGLVYTPMRDAPSDQDSAQAAAEYNRMLRDRAGAVLTPEQLAVYEKMQKEALQMYHSSELLSGRRNMDGQAD